MSDNSYASVAQSVLRLVASAVIMGCLFLYAADFLLYLTHKPLPGALAMAGPGITIFLAIIVIVKSRALAERFTRDLD